MTSIIPFQQLAQLCVDKGITKAIICPGSRNAALTVAFTANKALKCFSISDERSAAYIALGMALQEKKPVVIICTSGTAALNFAPALAEAYFQEIPLIVLTADRPKEWIHQYDGQTIFQEYIYGKHVKKAAQWLPDQSAYALQYAERISNELLNLSQLAPLGPIHLNIPIREPFYPEKINSEWTPWRNIQNHSNFNDFPKGLAKLFKQKLNESKKRILLIGQQSEPELRPLANAFTKKFGFILLADTLSNADAEIKSHDVFLKNISLENKELLKPDFLISTDKSLISKTLKVFLRNAEIAEHWHIQPNTDIIDPFLSVTVKFLSEPKAFLKALLETDLNTEKTNYPKNWKDLESEAKAKMDTQFETMPYSEILVLKELIQKFEQNSIIHVGNSMSVRYLNVLGAYLPENAMIYCNRGTSGIDGSLSTAVGQALATDKAVYCILGDLSFQYDKNALWNSHLPDNLKIIILNNAGGIIFSMIDGPKKQDSFESFFKTKQTNKADLIAKEFGLKYFKINTLEETDTQLVAFLNLKEKSILEIFTDADVNIGAYKSLMI